MTDKAIKDIAKILVANHYIINREKTFDIQKILLPLIRGWGEFGDNGPTITVVVDYKGIAIKSESSFGVIKNSFTWSEVPNGSDLEAIQQFMEKILREYFYIGENT